eukprot:1216173-Pyramimonas_sp.AAC.1
MSSEGGGGKRAGGIDTIWCDTTAAKEGEGGRSPRGIVISGSRSSSNQSGSRGAYGPSRRGGVET